MSFSDELRSRSDTVKRSGADYIKFTPEYRVVVRMLSDHARTVWKHYIQTANGGKGMSAVCPNTTAQTKVCPVCAQGDGFGKDSDEYKNSRPRRKFIVNVLDRTPVVTCPSCQTVTPGKNCTSCKADVSKIKGKPVNKVKILEQGPKVFNEQLNQIEKMQQDDLGKSILEYDVVFATQGTGRDKKILATPGKVEELQPEDLIDPETGEPQKMWDLDTLTEPTSVEVIEAMLRGDTIEQINALQLGGQA